MNQYMPDMVKKTIFDIDYNELYNKNIRFLLYDLDNTLTPYDKLECSDKTKKLFEKLKEKGFKTIIFSNSPKGRIKKFSKMLNIDFIYLACKPLSFKFKKAMSFYKFENSETAIIGDQLLTDIKGGNRVGIYTILVNPLVDSDGFFTKFNRKKEIEIKRKLGL